MADNELLDEEENNLTLEPGVTVIGKEKGKYREQIIDFTYYYGNHTSPMVTKNGKQSFIKLKDQEYLKLLNKFLSSDEGIAYKKPTEKEIEDANRLMLEKEEEMISSQNNKIHSTLPQSTNQDELISMIKNSKGEQPKILTKEDEEIISAELENIKQIKEQRKQISDLQKKLDAASKESKRLKEEKEKSKKKHLMELINASKDFEKYKEEKLFYLVSSLLIFSSIELVALILITLYR